MKIKHVLATAGAALAMAGMTATTAQADYDLTGGNYTGDVEGRGLEFSTGGAGRVYCENMALSGNTDNVAGDPASTALVPTFVGCGEHYSTPLVAKPSDPWKLTVTGPPTSGSYDAVLSTPNRTLVEFVDPVVEYFPELEPFVCKYTFKTPVGGAHVRVSQGPLGLYLDTAGANLAYDGNDYCAEYGSGASWLSTGGPILLSGVGIDEL